MEESIPATRLGQSTRGFPLWAYALAFGLSLIYAPMLGCRFDFIDDGNLVYSTPGDADRAAAGRRLGENRRQLR